METIGCDIEVMPANQFSAETFAPFIAGRRPLLVRGLASTVAPRLVEQWRLTNFQKQYGVLEFQTSPVGYPSTLSHQLRIVLLLSAHIFLCISAVAVSLDYSENDARSQKTF